MKKIICKCIISFQMPYVNINSIKIFLEKRKRIMRCVLIGHTEHMNMYYSVLWMGKKCTFISHTWSSISFNMKYKVPKMINACISYKLMISNNKQQFYNVFSCLCIEHFYPCLHIFLRFTFSNNDKIVSTFIPVVTMPLYVVRRPDRT